MRRGEAEGWRWGDCHGERLMESEPEAAAAVAVAVAEDAVTRAGELSTDNCENRPSALVSKWPRAAKLKVPAAAHSGRGAALGGRWVQPRRAADHTFIGGRDDCWQRHWWRHE